MSVKSTSMGPLTEYDLKVSPGGVKGLFGKRINVNLKHFDPEDRDPIVIVTPYKHEPEPNKHGHMGIISTDISDKTKRKIINKIGSESPIHFNTGGGWISYYNYDFFLSTVGNEPKEYAHNVICAILGTDKYTIQGIDYTCPYPPNDKSATINIPLRGPEVSGLNFCFNEQANDAILAFAPMLKVPACYDQLEETKPKEIKTLVSGKYSNEDDEAFVSFVYFTDPLRDLEPPKLFKTLLDFRKSFFEWTKTVKTYRLKEGSTYLETLLNQTLCK